MYISRTNKIGLVNDENYEKCRQNEQKICTLITEIRGRCISVVDLERRLVCKVNLCD